MKFDTIVALFLAMCLGYILAAKPAEAAASGSIADSLYRMATALEHLEEIMRRGK